MSPAPAWGEGRTFPRPAPHPRSSRSQRPMTDPKPPDKPNTSEAREPEPLTERIADWRPPAAGVDPAAGVVRGVALCGTTSRNGYGIR